MTYNLLGLSPDEFEIFGADFLARMQNRRFELFSAGRDRGMDGRHSTAAGDVIMQAKRYSTWKNLLSVMKSEREKVKRLDPLEYWLLTTIDLNPDQKDDLVAVLDHEAVSAERIMGQKDILLLLSKEEYKDVVLSNVKLWTTSAQVLGHLIDAAVRNETQLTRDQIERVAQVFVTHAGLQAADAILRKRHALILTGPPGVGKSTLAQVLCAHLVDDGWRLVAINDIADAHLPAANDRIIYLYDDFLGTGGVDGRDLGRNGSRILTRFQHVRRSQNMRIIMTTRAMQFEEALRLSEQIDDDDVRLTQCHVDLQPFSREIKAKILYNHLFHSGLPRPHILATIGQAKRIVDHPNFVPRLIADVTRAHNCADLTPDDYAAIFIETLSDPAKIWRAPYENQISVQARVVLICLLFSSHFMRASFARNTDNLQTFFEAAARELMRNGVDIVDLNFARAARSLENSFIVNEGGRLSFINPSVGDYLETIITKDILSGLAAVAPDIATARRIWQFAKRKRRAPLPKLARILQQTIAGQPAQLESFLSDYIAFATELFRAHACKAFETTVINNLPPLDLVIVDIPTALEESFNAQQAGLSQFDAVSRELVATLRRFLKTEPDETNPNVGLLVDLVREFSRRPSPELRGGVERTELAAQAYGALSRAVSRIDIPDRGEEGDEQRLREIRDALEMLPGELARTPSIARAISRLDDALVVFELDRDAEIDSGSLRMTTQRAGGFTDENLYDLFGSLRHWALFDGIAEAIDGLE